MNESFPVRVGANAVVTSGDRILAVKFEDDAGRHYNLPGGGVEPGERLPDAVAREVHEETTAEVEVGELLFVHEYYPPDHGEKYGATHKLTHFFESELSAGSTPGLPDDPDPDQVGVEWLPLDGIENQPLVPDLGDGWRAIATGGPGARYVDDG